MTKRVRLALLASLALAWLNFLLTSRWAQIPGTLHGWRRPYVLALLAAATAAALFARRRDETPLGPTAVRVIWCASAVLLAGAFLQWFPLSTWTRVPFLDNWPPRYQSTVDGIALLREGAFNGWQWAFLGGYHTSSDITQNLTLLGLVPMTLLGSAVGFHLLQLLLFLAVPLIVYLDLEDDSRDHAILSSAFAMLVAGNFSYMFIRSGDTNSVAGVACAALTIAGSHAARRGARWGWPLLVTGFVLTGYSHIGFFGYTALFIALDALCARDRATFWRGVTAGFIALIVMLPATWELIRYPDYFNFNNIVYERGGVIEGPSLARKIYYNIELLFLPGRWTNDYTGLSLIFLPVVALVAWTERARRVGFYAAAVLLTELLLRLNVPQFGYVFMRPMHLLALFTPPVLAWFVWRLTANRTVAVTLVAFIAIYVQIILLHVPHVSSLDDMNPSLIQRIRSADGGLVLVENSPHRDMDAAPATVSEPTPFGVHWEPLLPSATGRRFYAGFWDGWQWSPWRGQTLAGGTLFGQQIELIPIERFESEMRRWGVRRLFVWSAASVRYLNGHSQFERVWSAEPWHEFVYAAGDSREVITASHGTATLSHVTPLGATVQLDAVEAGEEVVVRTNHYPAWELRSDDARIPHYERNGQLAFRAPHRGRQTLELVYPRRLALTLLALAVWLMAVSWRKTGLGVRYDR